MPLQHEINARIDVAGKRIHRGGDLFAGGHHRTKPLLQRLLEIAQSTKTECLDGADDGSIRRFKQRRDLHRRLFHHRFTIFIDIGRPAICDCTCAAMSPNEANEFEMASSREIST